MQRGTTPLIFLIIIFILIIGFGVWKLGSHQSLIPSPPPESSVDKTADWKTYTNIKYNYSYKYPNTWFLVSSDEDQKIYDGLPETLGPAYTISLSVNTIDKGVNISDPVGTKKEVGNKIYEEKVSNYLLDNFKGVRIKTGVGEGSQTDAVPSTGVKLYLASNQIIYITLLCLDDKCTKYNEIFDQLLSSFKVTESTLDSGEKARIDIWLEENNLNQYGDSQDTAYTGGTPLFNEMSGETQDRYEFILENNPDRPWNK